MDNPNPKNLLKKSTTEAQLFNEQVKSARIKSAVTAVIPTLLTLFTFITFFPYKTGVFATIISVFLLTIVPFTLIYQFAFALKFGKNLLPELHKKQKFFESMPYTETDIDSMVDDLNVARGFAPGKGYIESPSPSNINLDNHHYR